MNINIEQFHQIFFEESIESLDNMEHALLQIGDGSDVDLETVNTIFRAAHSIKGSSGTFGFYALSEFTHVLETLLDKVRDGKKSLDKASIDLLLKSCDCLRSMINNLINQEEVDDTLAKLLVTQFEALDKENNESIAIEDVIEIPEQSFENSLDNDDQNSSLKDSFDNLFDDSKENPPNNSGNDGHNSNDDNKSTGDDEKCWLISFIPEQQILLTGNEPYRLFRELNEMGTLEIKADTNNLPSFELLHPDECYLSWNLKLITNASKQDIEEVFEWVIDECDLKIVLFDDAENINDLSNQHKEKKQQSENINDNTIKEDTTEKINKEINQTSSIKEDVDVEESLVKNPNKNNNKTDISNSNKAQENSSDTTVSKNSKPSNKPDNNSTQMSQSSIRVAIDKVDNLINLVGELVITQSMLSQLDTSFDMEKLHNGLEQLQNNTRELQESVMRIRMLPISFAFNRFPRMIRDLASKTGKQVDLKVSGEQTELDKTVMEKISDPLVHLVRNAIDHGIESSEARLASGKPEQGTINLTAFHLGGNIVIEIKDDGKGLDTEKILNKAKEKGLVESGRDMTEQAIQELIFEPGFSTAKQVTDISGRGVGMDVVRKNIKSLGGRVELFSKAGEGTTFKVHLPLTLAILDGQLVKVGNEIYIIPLISIVESLQIKKELVNTVSGGINLYRLREENVPIIALHKEFNIESDKIDVDGGLLVVVESEGQKLGLLVDDLLAQQQVVIKSLEQNYKSIPGISGATILGDGSVALILDIPGFIHKVSTNLLNVA